MTDRATRATSGDTRDLIGCNSGRGAFKGKAGKPFLVTWSAAAAATGFLFDMQVRVSQDRSFDDSLVGQTATAATYVPETAGNYAFRARLRSSGTGAAKMVATGCDNGPKSLGSFDPETGNLFPVYLPHCVPLVKTEELGEQTSLLD